MWRAFSVACDCDCKCKYAYNTTGSQCVLNELLYRGGVRLTVMGTNLTLVQRPHMNSSVLIRQHEKLNHTYAITVRKRSSILQDLEMPQNRAALNLPGKVLHGNPT